MSVNRVKAPFPWFGGKADAAPTVWQALGDVVHYVEPFGGTLAVLLRRPHPANRAYFSETVNDADGLLVNFWRSVQMSPDETAAAASWPVTEADKIARSAWVLDQARRLDMEALMGDPTLHDPLLAGWWAWCVCVTIGAFGAGGPWWPDADGRLRKWGWDEPRPAVGVSRELPHLGDDGKGVNRPQMREPGVSRQLPHLGDDGKGVNHAGTREPGVCGDDFHDIVMPELVAWLRFLAARLRHVRIINGDWKRAVGAGAALTLSVRQGKGPAGVFLDPPYESGADVYRDGHGQRTVAVDVAEWAASKADDERWRIVAAGYDGDGTGDIYLSAGFEAVEWFRTGHLKGGYGADAHRERLYVSPSCLPLDSDEQGGLF